MTTQQIGAAQRKRMGLRGAVMPGAPRSSAALWRASRSNGGWSEEPRGAGTRGWADASGFAGLDPTHDLGLGTQLSFDGIEPHAAAHCDGPEADLSSIPKPEDLQRLLYVYGPCSYGSLIKQFLPPLESPDHRLFCSCHWICGRPHRLTIFSDANPFRATCRAPETHPEVKFYAGFAGRDTSETWLM